MVEEGQPEFIEQALNTILRRRDIQTRIVGKDVLPMAGEYTAAGRRSRASSAFLELHAQTSARQFTAAARCGHRPCRSARSRRWRSPCRRGRRASASAARSGRSSPRMKLVRAGARRRTRSPRDIGCHLFSILPPFNIGATTMGYGLGPASASAFNVKADKKPISRDRRRRLLAQRAVHQHRQRRLQQAGRRHHGRRQLSIPRPPAARTSCRRARSIRRARPTTPSSTR